MRDLIELGKELKTEIAVETMMMMVAPTKKQKAGSAAIMASGTVLGSMASFLAADASNFQTQVNDLTSSLFKAVLGISTGIFFLFLAINFIRYAVSSDPGAAREAKSNIKKVIIGWVAINMIGLIAQTIVNLTANGNGGGDMQTTGTLN